MVPPSKLDPGPFEVPRQGIGSSACDLGSLASGFAAQRHLILDEALHLARITIGGGPFGEVGRGPLPPWPGK